MSAARDRQIDALRRRRPRDRLLRGSVALLLCACAGAWLFGGFDFADAWSPRRLANLARFAREVVPFPLQGQPFDPAVAWHWLTGILLDHGLSAMLATLAIAIVAIDLALLVATPLAVAAASNVTSPRPFSIGGPAPRGQAVAARLLVELARGALICLRSLPEYVLAFLLIAVLGPSPWPLVLALACHNAGILGRLLAEVVENVDERPLRALTAAGATRLQVVACGVTPLVLPRALLFFCYRFESCIRDATVLGMLSVSSLGYWIDEYRTRMQYDDFVLMILLGSLLVFCGDLGSAWLRSSVRRAT